MAVTVAYKKAEVNIMNLASETGLLNTELPEIQFTAGLAVDTKSSSPASDYLVDEEAASICPLLTPSPPVRFEHPLSLLTEPDGMAYERQISPSSTDPELSALPTLNGNATYVGLDAPKENHRHLESTSVQSVLESSSSSSSVTQEPTVCAQLLSSYHYQHLGKGDAVFACQENGGKPQLAPIQLAVHKSVDDYVFLNWNWPVIRSFTLVTSVSIMIACLCIAITLIAQMPGSCNPPNGWWQGTLFYEVFPASFQDSNHDGIGDLQGLNQRVAYFDGLGVKAVRLNSIFLAENYPDHFMVVKNLTEIDPVLGSLQNFKTLVRTLHRRNISIILDLPVYHFVNQLTINVNNDQLGFHIENTVSSSETINNTAIYEEVNNSVPSIKNFKKEDGILHAMRFWLNEGVDGFYLKGIEYFVNSDNFILQLNEWRKLVSSFNEEEKEKILMCKYNVVEILKHNPLKLQALLNRMDLIDVHLNLFVNDSNEIKSQIEDILNDDINMKPNYPWIHWNIGSIETKRLASQHGASNGSLAALLFNLMLPGTPSIFYGDEIGLLDYELSEILHPRQLVPMHWLSGSGLGFTSPNIMPWVFPSSSLSTVAEGLQTAIGMMTRLRSANPAIYMNGVWKDSERLPNFYIRYLDSDIIVMERSYPRRHSYMVVSNLGSHTQVRDLSYIYYGGQIVLDLHGRAGSYITFKSLVMYAGETIIIKLDK